MTNRWQLHLKACCVFLSNGDLQDSELSSSLSSQSINLKAQSVTLHICQSLLALTHAVLCHDQGRAYVVVTNNLFKCHDQICTLKWRLIIQLKSHVLKLLPSAVLLF